ncbi:MAG: metallophosphoesterase [Actinomycetota bacterium]
MGNVRILHVSDIHNNLRAARFAMKFALTSGCDVVVDTGDLSGIGGWWERFFLLLVPEPACPLVFAPGNHDGRVTIEAMRRRGANVLDDSGVVEVAGLKFWGYRDPNRTKLFGKPYDNSACEHAATENPVPEGVDVVAVHNRKMVRDAGPNTVLVLSGHLHKTVVDQTHSPAWVTAGAAGEGGPLGRVFEAVLIDLVDRVISEATVIRLNLDEARAQLPPYGPQHPTS